MNWSIVSAINGLATLFTIFLIGCGDGKISNLVTNINKVAAECGPEAISLGSSYQFYRFLDQENNFIPMNEIVYGNVNSGSAKKGLVAVGNNCLAIEKSSTRDPYVYTFLKDIKFGKVLPKNALKGKSKVNLIKLPELKVLPDHLRSCGTEGPHNKSRSIAIKLSFDSSYKKDKSFKNYQVKVSHLGKTDDSLKLNKYDCLYIAEDDKEKVVEVIDNSSGEILFRRPINIWMNNQINDLDKTQITICGKGIYKFEGSCVSHLLYYCHQRTKIKENLRNLLIRVRMPPKSELEDIDCEFTEWRASGIVHLETFTIKRPLSLEPMFFVNSLESIVLEKNSISDLTSFTNFKKLTRLILPNNKITDISPLLDLPNLEELDLSRNSIKDYDSLKNIKSLKNLKIQFNKINNISFISQLINLTELNLSFSEGFEDISVVRHLKDLVTLEVNEVILKEIPFDSPMPKLKKLSFARTGIKDIKNLVHTKNLVELELYGLSAIEDISSLANLTNLTYLSLTHNKVSNITPLQNLTELTHLDLEEARIKSIAILNTLPKLSFLDLKGNEVNDVSSLQGIVSLTKLNLSYNEIKDISPLSSLTKLEHLDLYKNKIEDLSPLKDLPNLIKFSAHQNPLGDTIKKTEGNCPTNSLSRKVSDWCRDKFF